LRLATTIISLILMVGVGFQSCAVTVGAALGEDEQLAGGAATGVFVAFLFLIGGAFAIGYPMVSLVTFVLAGVFALIAGIITEFKDLAFWGGVAFVLAVLSFFGWREKRKQGAESQSRVV
jgi:hypothetical protein